MDLLTFKMRLEELDRALTMTTNQVYILQGHKQEVQFHIDALEKAEEVANTEQNVVE